MNPTLQPIMLDDIGFRCCQFDLDRLEPRWADASKMQVRFRVLRLKASNDESNWLKKARGTSCNTCYVSILRNVMTETPGQASALWIQGIGLGLNGMLSGLLGGKPWGLGLNG